MATKSASPEAFQILREIGVIDLPEDWDIVRVESLLCDERGIAVGVMYPGDHDPAGIPLIKAGDLFGNRVNPRPEFRITADKHHEYRRTELTGGELLISLVGDVGRCAPVPPEMAGWNAARAIAVLRFSRPADAAFVRDCLMSSPLQLLMQAWSTTTVQATLNLKEIRQIPLPWPPKEQRDAIVHILRTLDDKIELNRTIDQTLETLARATFKSWFVDFDPIRAKAEGRQPYGMDAGTVALFPDSFEDSELGKIPKKWRVAALGELIEIIKGRSYKSEELIESDTALVTLKSFARGGGYRPDGLKSFAGTYKPEQVVEAGDVVIACTDVTQAAEVIGRPAVVRQSTRYQRLVASLDTLIIRPKDGRITRAFLFLLCSTGIFTEHTYAYTTGTTVLHLAKEAVPSFRFPLPSEKLVRALDHLIGPILARIQHAESETETLGKLCTGS
ncbi:MAG: restriction endonuclease subunit S [Candidatus Binatus sp.]|uniref:restriction endonuclease subunit S n=1 Tax=Candidatus Binatus sp. TaxID=2811406 RepID=UPI003C725645